MVLLTEKGLLKAAILIAFIGLLSLWLIIRSGALPISDLTVVDDGAHGSQVRVRGSVSSVRHVGNITLLSIQALVEKKAVVFDSINITPGTSVFVEGEIQDYDGERELVVAKIDPINDSS